MRDTTAALQWLADMGIPMIALTLPAMVILLIPVIAIESLLCKRWLGLTLWEAVKANTVSNLASTILGVPVAWAILLGVEYAGAALLDQVPGVEAWHSPLAGVLFFILSSAWIGPPDRTSIWVIPAACLVLLVPFFFASYLVEYLVIRDRIGKPEGDRPNLGYPRVRIAVRNANLITYGIMFLSTTIWLVRELPHH